MKVVGPAIIGLALVASFAATGSPGLQIALETPDIVKMGELFEVRIIVSNIGNEPFVFKKHWKWAPDTWIFEAKDNDGNDLESTGQLFCIESPSMCSFFIPLFPGESFSTTTVVNDKVIMWDERPPPGAEDVPSEIQFGPNVVFLEPGRHSLRLRYTSDHRPKEQHCASGDLGIWEGQTASPWVEFEVVPNEP